jgi:hypothetical protein
VIRLQRRMVNPELLRQQFLHFPPSRVAILVPTDQQVG